MFQVLSTYALAFRKPQLQEMLFFFFLKKKGNYQPKFITWGQRWSCEGSSQRPSGTLLPPSQLAFLPLSWDKHNKVLFLPHSPLAWWAQQLLLYQWSHQHIFEQGLYLKRTEAAYFFPSPCYEHGNNTPIPLYLLLFPKPL